MARKAKGGGRGGGCNRGRGGGGVRGLGHHSTSPQPTYESIDHDHFVYKNE